MGKVLATIKKAIQPDITKWIESDNDHDVIFDNTHNVVMWSFRSSGDTPDECDTISVVHGGEYFEIKYNTATKYIITKHGDIFINDYTVDSNVVSDLVIYEALKQAFLIPDPTDAIFSNEIFNAIRDWIQTHINGANVHMDNTLMGISKNGSRLSTIDIRSAINHVRAKCVRINGSFLAIWSGNEWIISNNQLTGCTGRLSINEVGLLQDVIVHIKPEQRPESTDEPGPSDSKLFEDYLANLSPEDAKYLPDAMLKSDPYITARFDTFKNIMDDLISHGNTTTQKPEPKISTMESSEQKPDSTDEQLLESSNVKSFDELWEMWEAANNKYTPDESFELWRSVAAKHTVPPLPSMSGEYSLKFDIHNQTVDLKSLNNDEQKPNRNRQMMNRIRPIIIKWLKDVVDTPGPFSSFEEVSEPTTSLKYSFILHGDRDANISMEIPYGFIGTMFILHDGCKIMRIGPDDVVLLLPLLNIDPDIQINRLHNLLYEILIIKRRRSKIDEIIKCITFFIRATWPDIQYSICGRHIDIIKRSAASDAPVGSIRIGFSYKPGYLLTIWQDNDYDHPLIDFDDKWKPVMFDPQDKFTRKMYSWLSVNFGCEEENPVIISDSLAKSLCRSDKVIPIKFTPRTHNFKSWASIGFTEAANLRAMPEDAELIMKVVKERNNMIKIPEIKNVLFNDTKRTTTVLFEDGTITMSKSMNADTYDHEVGFAMCIMKKIYGNRTRFQKEIKRWTSVCENANKKIADKAAKKQDKNDEEVTVS